jgi:nicotinamidase/pyrazinamidase
MITAENTGVIVVDVQADFTELNSGALAVPGTDAAYIGNVQKTTRLFHSQGLRIYYTLDWHPEDHISFYTNNPGTEPFQEIELKKGRTQVMWPPHCVQNTPGAEILLDIDKSSERIQTGANPKFDSYSGFEDDGGNQTGLDRVLRRDGIKKLIIYGLATDYCVKHTALDAVELGYQVELLADLCRGITPETTASALEEMEARGVNIISD